MNSSADQQLPIMDNITFLLTFSDHNSTASFMESTPIPSDSDEQSLCIQIELTLKKPLYLTVLHVNLLILATTLASIAFLVQKYTKERIIAHGNLLVCKSALDRRKVREFLSASFRQHHPPLLHPQSCLFCVLSQISGKQTQKHTVHRTIN